MKIATVLGCSILFAAFAAGCAAEAPQEGSAAPEAIDVEEGDDALRRSTVVGTYVRKVHTNGCNLVRTLKLKADGSYVAELSYSAPQIACPAVVAEPQQGRFTVNATSRVTFKPSGTRDSFTLNYNSGVLSGVRSGQALHGSLFAGAFKKIGATSCVAQSDCLGMNYCEFPVYAPATPAHAYPPVVTGTCISALRYCDADAGERCPNDEVCVYLAGRSDGIGFCRHVD